MKQNTLKKLGIGGVALGAVALIMAARKGKNKDAKTEGEPTEEVEEEPEVEE